ncbi:hypothetical protein G6F68_010139 [Rhizopus microsporus]|nr:hypothetical protein G6F68_010139 [Rhizopus microsporus]
MVSGFTDDAPVREGNRRFADNWELSAQRSLTVTRTLIADGVPADAVFAAAFGSEQPVSSNASEDGRARNRRPPCAGARPRCGIALAAALPAGADAAAGAARVVGPAQPTAGASLIAHRGPGRRRPAELGGTGAAHAGHDAVDQPRLPAPFYRLRGHLVLVAGTAGRHRQRRARGGAGAGRTAEVGSLFSEASDNFKAYGVAGHRHHPEIVAQLEKISGGKVGLTFVPHLVPMIRGMFSTIYARILPEARDTDFQALFEQRYADEPFVDVMPAGSLPETRSVRASNNLRIALSRPGNGDQLIVLVVQDNLVKGAAGQAVQNMNLMFGVPESTGLDQVAILP